MEPNNTIHREAIRVSPILAFDAEQHTADTHTKKLVCQKTKTGVCRTVPVTASASALTANTFRDNNFMSLK